MSFLILANRNIVYLLFIGILGCSQQPKVLLVDGDRKLGLDSSGRLSGGEGLTASQSRTVAGLLGGAPFPVPRYLKDVLADDFDVVKSEELVPLEPVRVIVTTDLPTFRWKGVIGANSYEVLIRDHRDIVVKRSGSIEETEWTPSKPLAQGEVFHWRVTVGRGREGAVSHWTKFAVPGEASLTEIESARRLSSRLLLAIAYARCGAVASTDKELIELENTTTGSELVKRWRTQLH